MNRRTAKSIHRATNICFWAENPDWNANNIPGRLACRVVRILPFSVHETLKKVLFDNSRIVAVNGESIVVTNGKDKVDKFMFRIPKDMPTGDFQKRATHEIGAVTQSLAGIALPTEVSIKPANIFRFSRKPVVSVAQTQTRLDLDVNERLDLSQLAHEQPSPQLDRTVQDLELMLTGIETLVDRFGLYPDVSYSSANLRRNRLSGAVTLIDVMPIYADGTRLIADDAVILPSTLKSIDDFQDFVGQYRS